MEKHLTLKSLLRDVLLPWEMPAATTAPEWIMGPSFRYMGGRDAYHHFAKLVLDCTAVRNGISHLPHSEAADH